MSKKITLLGSTGSIGTQSLDVIRAQGYEVFGLSAHSHVEKILEQIEEFHPRYVCMTDPDAAARLDAALATCRLAKLVGRLPATSSCSACSLASYSSCISGVRPTPGVVVVLVQDSQVRCSCSPSTRTAQAAASSGERQVSQARLPLQLPGSMLPVAATSRPLSRL